MTDHYILDCRLREAVATEDDKAVVAASRAIVAGVREARSPDQEDGIRASLVEAAVRRSIPAGAPLPYVDVVFSRFVWSANGAEVVGVEAIVEMFDGTQGQVHFATDDVGAPLRWTMVDAGGFRFEDGEWRRPGLTHGEIVAFNMDHRRSWDPDGSLQSRIALVEREHLAVRHGDGRVEIGYDPAAFDRVMSTFGSRTIHRNDKEVRHRNIMVFEDHVRTLGSGDVLHRIVGIDNCNMAMGQRYEFFALRNLTDGAWITADTERACRIRFEKYTPVPPEPEEEDGDAFFMPETDDERRDEAAMKELML